MLVAQALFPSTHLSGFQKKVIWPFQKVTILTFLFSTFQLKLELDPWPFLDSRSPCRHGKVADGHDQVEGAATWLLSSSQNHGSFLENQQRGSFSINTGISPSDMWEAEGLKMVEHPKKIEDERSGD